MQGAQVPGVVSLVNSKIEPIEQILNPAVNMGTTKKRSLDGQSSPDGAEIVDDEKLAKKQRRLVKNREAAAQFRHRQKAYMQKLEKHAEELSQSNVQVTAKIELLDTENKLMKEQLNYLRNFMKQAVALSFPNSLPSLPPDSTIPPNFSQPSMPEFFPDDMLEKKEIKMEPLVPSTASMVPDISNPHMFSPPISPPSIHTPVQVNPVIISAPTPVPTISPPPSPLPLPPSIQSAIHAHNPLIPSPMTPPIITSIPPTTNTITQLPPSFAPPPAFAPPPSFTSSPSFASPSLITSTNLLNDAFLSTMNSSGPSMLGASTNLGSSASLSSIFNSILGTDLSFSGVLVKTEPPANQD